MTDTLAALVLECPGCGRAVAHGTDSEPKCAACGTRVPLPQSQQQAHQTIGEHAELGAAALDLGERIGTAPSPVWRLLTLFEGDCALYLMLPFVLISALTLFGSSRSPALLQAFIGDIAKNTQVCAQSQPRGVHAKVPLRLFERRNLLVREPKTQSQRVREFAKDTLA